MTGDLERSSSPLMSELGGFSGVTERTLKWASAAYLSAKGAVERVFGQEITAELLTVSIVAGFTMGICPLAGLVVVRFFLMASSISEESPAALFAILMKICMIDLIRVTFILVTAVGIIFRQLNMAAMQLVNAVTTPIEMALIVGLSLQTVL